jgi:hypothetical protein
VAADRMIHLNRHPSQRPTATHPGCARHHGEGSHHVNRREDRGRRVFDVAGWILRSRRRGNWNLEQLDDATSIVLHGCATQGGRAIKIMPEGNHAGGKLRPGAPLPVLRTLSHRGPQLIAEVGVWAKPGLYEFKLFLGG